MTWICPGGLPAYKIYFFTLVFLVPFLLYIVLPRVSIRYFVDSVSYNLSKKLYHVWEPSNLPDTSSAPDLVVRSVYFDDRPRGGHKNVIVFLIEVRKTILTRGVIVGCEVGNLISTQVKVHRININGWVGEYVDEKPFLSHTMALVDCYNLPAQNGTSATLHCKRIQSQKAMVVPAVSQRPLPQLRTNIEIQYHSQMLAYHDCICQFRSRFEYMIFADQDDFFVPLVHSESCLLYTSPSPRDATLSRMPSSA